MDLQSCKNLAVESVVWIHPDKFAGHQGSGTHRQECVRMLVEIVSAYAPGVI